MASYCAEKKSRGNLTEEDSRRAEQHFEDAVRHAQEMSGPRKHRCITKTKIRQLFYHLGSSRNQTPISNSEVTDIDKVRAGQVISDIERTLYSQHMKRRHKAMFLIGKTDYFLRLCDYESGMFRFRAHASSDQQS